MSLFGFADINFNKDTPRTQGPLRALEGSPFASSALRYPEDVGNFDKGHYMVFYIRQQENTAFKRTTVSDDLINSNSVGKTFDNVPLVGNVGTNLGGDLLNKLNSGLNSLSAATGGSLSGLTSAISGAASGIQSTINNLFGQAASIPTGDAAATQKILSSNLAKITGSRFIKTTSLTNDAIALYMPDTLMYSHEQTYEEAPMGNEIAGKAVGAGQAAYEAYKKGGESAALGSLAQAGLTELEKGLADYAGSKLGQNTSKILSAAFLGVRNPMLELLYSSPQFRTFQFDFSFYPRNEKEALEVQKIIERFRFHQAPEFKKESQGFLIPPSEFDIRFYYGGYQNPNIPKIATCVLKKIDVNYAPNGFSAYEVPGESQPALGRTGMPVAIQMTLEFSEVVFLTKRDFTSEEQFGKI